MAKRANGEGSIRRRTDGTWESRLTVNGKRRSVYGKTQAEVRRKLEGLKSARDNGIDLDAARMTVSEWLDIWMRDYRGGIKDSTKASYAQDIRLHIVPYIGKIQLARLKAADVQKMYNLVVENGLSPKSVKNTHGILHKALSQAVKLGFVEKNVCDCCELPAIRKKEMHPIVDETLARFLEAIRTDAYGDLMFVALFTGLRESELIGLTWDCIDFEKKKIRVYRQLSKPRGVNANGLYVFSDLKNKKERTFTPMDAVLEVLAHVREQQSEWKRKCGGAWDNPYNLVFTNETGKNLCTTTVWKRFKRIAVAIGAEESRFHDLRHSFATLSIEAGSDIKTVSESLGHATTAFTMDVYGHTSERMQQEHAQKLQAHISSLL